MKTRIIVISRKKIVITSIIITLMLSALMVVNAIAQKNPLEGRIIVVDAGHGGVDGGANNRYICEKDVNLDVALRLQKMLEENGAVVYMTRTEDVSLNKSQRLGRERYLEDLNTRLDIINSSDAHIFVSIHTNTNPRKPSTRGALMLYSASQPQNREIAYAIQNVFNTWEYSLNGKQYKSSHIPQKGQYYLLVNSTKPGVIAETGFISNSTDLFLLLRPDYREYIARCICQGLSDYFSAGKNAEDMNSYLWETHGQNSQYDEVIITDP